MDERQKQRRYDLCNRYIDALSSASSLYDLLNLHKKMWCDGLQHPNIGPNPYGMFRTENIMTMSDSEVYLGNLHGLWTLPLHEWVGVPEENIVFQQYRHHLLSNIELLRSHVYDHGLDREKIELAIRRDAPLGMNITDVKVLDKEMDTLKLMMFSFKVDGVMMKSNLFLKTLSNKDDLLLIPSNWYKGECVNSIHQIGKIENWKGVGHKDSVFKVKKEFLRRHLSVEIANNNIKRNVNNAIKR